MTDDGLPPNERLLAAFKSKLPRVEPTDRELSAFALGIEYAIEQDRARPVPGEDELMRLARAMRDGKPEQWADDESMMLSAIRQALRQPAVQWRPKNQRIYSYKGDRGDGE